MSGKHLIALFSLAALAACGEPERQPSQSAEPAAAGAEATPSSWVSFRQGFLEEWLAENPTRAVDLGKHQYDGLLPDYGPAGQAEYARKLERWMQEAGAIDAAEMSEAERFEREYLLSDLEEERFWLSEVELLYRSPLAWGYPAFPSVYLTREYAPLPERLDAFNTYLGNLPGYLEAMQSTIRGPIPRTWAETAVDMFGGLDRFFGSAVPEIFASVDDPVRQERLKQGLAGAREALAETLAWLGETPRDDSYALGPDLYRRMLWVTERVDTPLAELEAIAQADMERNLHAMREACAEFAPGASLVECAAKERSHKPPEGPVEGAKRQLGSLKQFVATNGIVSIPSGDPVTVDAAPPYNAANFAYIEIPGPYEKKLPAVYYIAPPDPSWTEEQQQEYLPGEAGLLFTSVHEVWPGHFLNYLHAKQSDSVYGRIAVGYAFAEGWAHYTEEMMWNAGLGDGDPETHIGQLTNALLRNARFISSIGLHTQGMSVEESQQLFVEKGLQDFGNAKQQAYRGTYDPAYLNYTIGKLMITKLRDDWFASNDGADTLQAFHDEFLSYGGPPIPMVRAAMLGEADDGDLFPHPASPDPQPSGAGEAAER